jgi:pimeloyl-ACP methyl ester carboxylesterase
MTHTVSVGENTLAYLRSGNGPAVVVIHGIGGHKEDWAHLAQSLAGSHTVYSVDMLGFGGSSKTGQQITIADQVAAIIGLLDAEKIERADLVGNSVGGWVAATFAADHPTRTDRLVLVDAAGFKAMFEGKPPVDFYPQDLAATANLLAHVRHDPSARTPEAVARELAESQASGDAQAAAAVGQGMFASPRLEDVADRVTAPTLIVWGAEDRLFPPAIADLVAGHIPNARKVLIPAASHFPQLDNPTAFDAAVVEFLRR